MRETVLGDGTVVRSTRLPGPGRPMVYVHGLGAASLAHFLHIASAPELRTRPAVFIDLPGFGLSDRPPSFDYSLDGHAGAVAAVIDDVAGEPVDLVGHSLGGSIGIVLADRRPDLVARLVVIEPNLLPWDGDASVAIARQDEEEFVGGGMARMIASIDATWAATFRLADPLAVHRTAVGLCRGSEPAMATMFARAAMPRFLLWGELTPRSPAIGDLVAHGVELREIAGSGHVPMVDAPDILASTLARLLDRAE